MIPYIIAFFISNIFVYCGEKMLKVKKKIGIIILIVSILPIVILGGLRTVDMGWDAQLYGEPIFNDVKNLDLSQLNSYLSTSKNEPGFIVLIYILSNIYKHINFVLFILISIISYSVLYFAYKNRNKSSIVFTMFLYEMVLYPITYSTLRQCTALAFVFIACSKFLEKKHIQTVILIIIASFFHSSAYMAIALFVVMMINDSRKITKGNKAFFNYFSIIVILICVLCYENVMKYLWSLGILKDKYMAYLGSKFHSETIAVRWPLMLYKNFNLIMGAIYFYSKAIPKEEKEENRKWYILLLFDFVMTLFSLKIVNAHRTTYYILFPALFIFIPQTVKVFKNDRKNRVFAYSIYGIIFLLYFITSLKYYSMYPYRWIL